MNKENSQPFTYYDWVDPQTKANLDVYNEEYWEKVYKHAAEKFNHAKGAHKDIIRCYSLQEICQLQLWSRMDRKERNVWSGLLEYFKSKGEPYSEILKDCETPKAKWIRENLAADKDGVSRMDKYQESLKNKRLEYYKACNYPYEKYLEKYLYWKDKDPDTAEAIQLWMEVEFSKDEPMNDEDKKVMKQTLDITKVEDISKDSETIMRKSMLESRLKEGRSKAASYTIKKELEFYTNGGTYEEWKLKKKMGASKPDVSKGSIVSFNTPDKK